jgi:RecJ-like exonuclease
MKKLIISAACIAAAVGGGLIYKHANGCHTHTGCSHQHEAAMHEHKGYAVFHQEQTAQTLLAAVCNFCKGSGSFKDRCTNSACRGGRVSEISQQVCRKCGGQRQIDQTVPVQKTASSSPREASTKVVKVNCDACRGSGYEKVETQVSCSSCGGSGFVNTPCKMCGGSGNV